MKGRKSAKLRQFVAGLSASAGAFALGTTLGWSAPASTRLVDEQQYFPISLSEMGWISSTVNIGCAISCLPIGFLMKKFGRKATMLSLVAPFVIGWSLITWAQNLAMLIVGRFFLGLAGGAFCVSAPQYSTEIAEKKFRGIIGSFFQLMLISGILFVYIVGALTTVFWMNLICSVVPLIFGAIFFFMPESPIYLIAEKDESRALKSFRCLRGKHFDALEEVERIKSEASIDGETRLNLKEVFLRPANGRAITIGIGLLFFMQMCGVNVVIFYATVIFNAAGSKLSPDVSTIIIGAIHVAASLVGSLLIDKAGRRPLLTLSITIMTFSLTTLGAFFVLQENDLETAKTVGWLPLTSLCVFIVFFALGFGPIPFMMISELYSKDINAIASPLTGFLNWILVFVLTLSFEPVSNAIGIGQTFWVFAGFSFVGIFFVLFMVPETKGKSMATIQNMLTNQRTFLK